MVRSVTILLGRYRFGILFFSLIFTMGCSPLLGHLGLARFIEVLLLINLIALVTAFGRKMRLLGASLIILAVLFRIIQVLSNLELLLPLSQGLAILFLILGIVACFRVVFGPAPVEREKILGSLSLYLLFGIVFSLLFAIVEESAPGSFRFPDGTDGTTPVLGSLLYFSYVTLATLGYGDITPVGDIARTLSILEAMTGQMYLVVVVARLVTLWERDPRGHGG